MTAAADRVCGLFPARARDFSLTTEVRKALAVADSLIEIRPASVVARHLSRVSSRLTVQRLLTVMFTSELVCKQARRVAVLGCGLVHS